MMRFRRNWLTSLPAAWLFGAIFIVVAAKLCELIPPRASGAPQDVYDVASHDRYVTHVALVFVIFACVYALLPRITRFGYRRALGRLHFWLAFLGINISLLPVEIVPLCCQPRRFGDASRIWAVVGSFSLAGLLISGFAMLTFIAMLFEAFMRKTPRAK